MAPTLSSPRLLPLLILSLLLPVHAIKFSLPATHHGPQKCLWNYALSDVLVVLSVSAPLVPVPGSPEGLSRVDLEVVDGSGSRNVYQSKRGIKGETRMAITTHADADLGVCFRNVLDPCTSHLVQLLPPSPVADSPCAQPCRRHSVRLTLD
jgi:hypothetical protein